MFLNCYYYAPHTHTLLTRHLDWDLEKIASLGSDAFTICVQEDQMTNWYQQHLTNVINRGHRFGLKVHAIPNRWAGMLAGWLGGISDWSLRNSDTFLPGGEARAFSDPRHPKVRAHFEENLKLMLTKYDFDGVIWDEPRPPTIEVINFLDEMSAYIKSIKPKAVVSFFAESGDLHLSEFLVQTKYMDYLGSDGHVRSEDHVMHRMKSTIFEAHAKFYPVLNKAGKKTMFLLEGQRHRDEDLENYLENLDKAFALPMDHLMWYYTAHEMTPEKADVMNEATWKAVAGLAHGKKNR